MMNLDTGINNFERLHDLFHAHGIPVEDQNWIFSLYSNPDLLANLFEVTPEWLKSTALGESQTKISPVCIFHRHHSKCMESWVKNLISYKEQALNPKIIFVQEKNNSGQESQTLLFIELTKKIKTNMTWQVLRNEEPPTWQEALWLVEKADLFFQTIQLESLAYQGLLTQSLLPIKEISRGQRGSLPLARLNPKQTEALSLYAEKLRYTMPMATKTW